MTLISVIIPVFNDSKNISETLESIKNQSYENWECIIVDDGSTDNTKEIILNNIHKDSRFKYNYKENGGLSSARNFGLILAKGNYIQFLDSDDIISPDKIKNQISFLEQHNEFDIIYSDYYFINSQNKFIAHKKTSVKIRINFVFDLICFWGLSFSIPINCFIYRKSFIDNINALFDEEMPAKEDLDFHLACALKRARIFYLNHTNAFYRVSPNSLSRNKQKMFLGVLKIFIKLTENRNLALGYKIIFIIQLSNELINVMTSIFKWEKVSLREIFKDDLFKTNRLVIFMGLTFAIIYMPFVIFFRARNIFIS